jgi:hypothetical protein
MSNERIHRWYESVMGFSSTIVRTALSEFNCDSSGFLLDPFCGTGTTLVESGLKGVPSIGIDANPFSAFCSRAKTQWNIEPNELLIAFQKVVDSGAEKQSSSNKSKKITYIPHTVQNGWVSPYVWDKATDVYSRIGRLRNRDQKQLLQLAVIAAIKETCANVAFGPEIYKRKRNNRIGVVQAIKQKVKQISEDLDGIQNLNATAKSDVFHEDSRTLDFLKYAGYSGKIKWLISSPPYPTEHDYSRIGRIELELGGFVQSKEDLRAVKKLQIRSNSKTVYSEDQDHLYVKDVEQIQRIVRKLEKISKEKTYSFAHRYPLVVGNYFGGLFMHLQSLAELMPSGGKCLYVLGDQRSYFGVLIPTTDIFIKLACEKLGAFRLIKRTTIRLRRGTNGSTAQIKEEATVLERI